MHHDKLKLTKTVQAHTFKDLKGHVPPIYEVLRGCTLLMLAFSFAVTFLANTSITGAAVVNATEQQSRFAGSSSLLLVIFVVFAFFIFILTKRMNENVR